MQISPHEIKWGLSNALSVLNLEVAYKEKSSLGKTHMMGKIMLFSFSNGEEFLPQEKCRSLLDRGCTG